MSQSKDVPDDDALLEQLISFLDSRYREELGDLVMSDDEVLELDYSDLRRGVPGIADDYLRDPETIREYVEEAIKQYDLPVPDDLSYVTVRITGMEELEEHIRDVGDYSPSEVAEGFVPLRGQVSKRSQPEILPRKLVYECQRCGTRTDVPVAGSDRTEPYECSNCERQGPWILLEGPSLQDAVDVQRLRLREPPEKSDTGTGDQIDVILEGDLVDSVEPGDRAVVGSTVAAKLDDDDGNPEFDLVAEAHSVDRLETNFTDFDWREYEDRIDEIANGDSPQEQIVDSIAPSHYGDRDLKEALALSMFGGVRRELPDGKRDRGSIHVFMIGDPGCGKSAMLRYIHQISPRSVYTSGTGSTAAGLTCAAVQDDFGEGGWTLEAGALVKANDGIACIDELDDMAEEDRAGMLEAMSDQTISVSKAGINAEMPARTTVLAAANPKHGRFDTYEPIAEQIDVHPALISRFDLIFTLSDEPDEELDSEIASRMTTTASVGTQRARGDDPDDAEGVEPAIDPEVLRAYVSRARDVYPTLTDAAEARIQQEYVALRQANDDDGPVPVTPRMVESMTRLAQASARMRISDEATIEDVERVLDLVDVDVLLAHQAPHGLVRIGGRDVGCVPMDRIVAELSPDLVLVGHYHRHAEATIGGSRAVSLAPAWRVYYLLDPETLALDRREAPESTP
ncbi:MAG: ATP-binding protein [Halapricum sp.]